MSFPPIYYINLDKRPDRKEHFERQIGMLGISGLNVTRISGVDKPGFGPLGCGLSHCKALEAFIESGASECIIFEDDFTFRPEHIEFCKKAIRTIVGAGDKAKYDVVMLAANTREEYPTKFPYLTRIKFAFTASGYLIKKEFAPVLLQNFKEACEGLERTGHVTPQYCIDVYWKKLQQEKIFYGLNPLVGFQYANYSDNEMKFVDYKV